MQPASRELALTTALVLLVAAVPGWTATVRSVAETSSASSSSLSSSSSPFPRPSVITTRDSITTREALRLRSLGDVAARSSAPERRREAEAFYRQALSLAQVGVTTDVTVVVQVLSAHSLSLSEWDRHEEAARLAQQCLQLLERSEAAPGASPKDLDVGRLLEHLADCRQLAGHPAAADEYLRQALVRLERVPDSFGRLCALGALQKRVERLIESSDMPAAYVVLEHAVAFLEAGTDAQAHYVSEFKALLANLCERQTRPAREDPLWRRLSALFKRRILSRPEDLVEWLVCRAGGVQSDPDAALRYLDRARVVAASVPGLDPDGLGPAPELRIQLLLNSDRFQAAAGTAAALLRAYEGRPDRGGADRQGVLSQLAAACEGLGDLPHAEQALRDRLSAAERMPRRWLGNLEEALRELAAFLTKHGRPAEAAAVLERLCASVEASDGRDSLRLIRPLRLLASAHRAAGRAGRADELRERARKLEGTVPRRDGR